MSRHVAPPHPPAVPHAGTEARPRSLGLLPYTIVGAALLTAAPFSLQWSQKAVTLSLDSADARIGRPLTPFSVAGVHRRAYRRAVYGAAAYGVGSYYGASGYGSSYGYPAYGYAKDSALVHDGPHAQKRTSLNSINQCSA